MIVQDQRLVAIVAKASLATPVGRNRWRMTRPGVEWSVTLAALWGDGQCGASKLDGYEVRVTKVGPAAGDYQLGGITGFVNVGGEDIARGASDDWISFFARNPGRSGKQRIGVIWYRAGDATPVVVAVPLPPDPTPPPPTRDDKLPLCDPVPRGVTFGAPINRDRAIHLALGRVHDVAPGTVVLTASLERAAEWKIKGEPTFTPDFGQIYGVGGRYSYASDDHRAVLMFDARCDDGRIVPRRVAIAVGWPVEQATKPAKLETSIVLELQADGSFVVAR